MTPRTQTIMRQSRANGGSDAAIAAMFSLTRERIGQLIGPARRPPGVAMPRPESHAALNARLPEAIYQWRTRRGLSQAKAAALVGVSDNVWSAWETRRHTCGRPAVLLRLLAALDTLDRLRQAAP